MEDTIRLLMTLPGEDRLMEIEQAFADKARLDKLQALTEKNAYTGSVIMRMSSSGRGWRLHETEQSGADSDVRGAIDRFFAELDPENELFE